MLKKAATFFSYFQNFNCPEIYIDQSILPKSDSTKFLGLFIDRNLKYHYHIAHIKSKLSKSIGILHRLKFMLPFPALLSLYYSLIFPYLSYAIEIWHSTSKYLTHQIFVLQKKAVRAIHLLPYNTETNFYFKKSSILKLEDLYKIQSCVQIFSALNSEDQNLKNYLQFRHNLTNRSTRNQNDLNLPRLKKTRSQLGFLYSSIREWNSLPNFIKFSKNISQFKKNIKMYYLSFY